MKLTEKQIKAIEKLTKYEFDCEYGNWYRFNSKEEEWTLVIYDNLDIQHIIYISSNPDLNMTPIRIPFKWLKPLSEILTGECTCFAEQPGWICSYCRLLEKEKNESK